jgi:hypothetical protein
MEFEVLELTRHRWANVVNAMYPGYTGARPRFQVYHGSIDTVRAFGWNGDDIC